MVSGTHIYSLCFLSHYRSRPGRLTPKSRKSNFDGVCSDTQFSLKMETVLVQTYIHYRTEILLFRDF